jgi:DNA-binding Xre family transcriptional regulator
MAEKMPPITQKQLIEETGLNSHTIGKLYNNKFSRVDKLTIEKLCSYFNCSLSDLFEL